MVTILFFPIEAAKMLGVVMESLTLSHVTSGKAAQVGVFVFTSAKEGVEGEPRQALWSTSSLIPVAAGGVFDDP